MGFIRSYEPTKFLGAELKNIRLDSDPILYRDLLDEQYLDKFEEKHPLIYAFWLFSSNCGRSVTLLAVWSLVIALLFGNIYSHLDFNYQTAVEWWRPYYLSFVTMTTLGVSSIEPGNFQAALAHTIQNVIGYGWLGYLISVLGAKFTRRSA